MLSYALIGLFVLGYCAITAEHSTKVDKAAAALVTGVLCWTVLVLGVPDIESVVHHLEEHLGEISGILFFLLGAMVIVEIIDSHNGFDAITSRIRTTDKRKLLWLLSFITFFLSALLDNLTTTIIIVSLLRKLIDDRSERLVYAGITVIAANAGGAWSPLGDVTTTMLWIGGQISARQTVLSLFLPSLICLIVPLVISSLRMKGHISPPASTDASERLASPKETALVLSVGLGILLMVPVFKTVTHLPPFMGMLLGVGILWIVTEVIHSRKEPEHQDVFSVSSALQRIDTPSILFFLGILLAVSALSTGGVLTQLAQALESGIGDLAILGILTGFLSAVVDNVPLVAAAQGMYPLELYPKDHFFWQFLAYCAGTGGSALIIGSAAGVAAMGLEKIDFFWYLKKITPIAVVGYLAGAATFLTQLGLAQ